MDAPVKGFNNMNGANSEKAKALQVALAQIEKQFGKGPSRPGRSRNRLT